MSQAKTKNFEDLLPVDQADLEKMYLDFYPKGSGPLGVMRYFCAALEELAEHRGYDTDFVALRKTHLPGVRHHVK